MTAFKEGQPTDYISFVVDGEFEVIKEDLSKMDHRIFGFVE
jgi:CRP-like cAMP-binding protein